METVDVHADPSRERIDDSQTFDTPAGLKILRRQCVESGFHARVGAEPAVAGAVDDAAALNQQVANELFLRSVVGTPRRSRAVRKIYFGGRSLPSISDSSFSARAGCCITSLRHPMTSGTKGRHTSSAPFHTWTIIVFMTRRRIHV